MDERGASENGGEPRHIWTDKHLGKQFPFFTISARARVFQPECESATFVRFKLFGKQTCVFGRGALGPLVWIKIGDSRRFFVRNGPSLVFMVDFVLENEPSVGSWKSRGIWQYRI